MIKVKIKVSDLVVILSGRAGGPMEVGEGGRHHGSHHASLSALLFAAVPGTEVAVVGQTKDMALGKCCN